MLGPRLVGVYVCSPMKADNIHVCWPGLTYILTDVDVVRTATHRKRGWSLCMYVRFWVASWAQKVPPLTNQIFLQKLNETVDCGVDHKWSCWFIVFGSLPGLRRQRAFRCKYEFSVCLALTYILKNIVQIWVFSMYVRAKVGWCVCMFAYEGRQHTCMLTWFNIHTHGRQRGKDGHT